MIKKILAVLAALLLMASFYVLVVIADPARDMEQSRWLVQEDAGAIAAMGALASANQGELAGAFGVAVPRLPGGGEGQVEDASYRGIPARLYTYRTEGGTVRAVRPADAAPLLLQSGYPLSGQSVALLGMQAAMASSGASRCLYFAGDDAAYALLAGSMSQDDFLLLAGELVF